jgi:hypothetical protein
MLLTPEQLEDLDVYGKSHKRKYGKLNIRPTQIYPYQRNIANANGRGKGRPERWVLV